jgi:hypothetical protein
VHGIFGPQYHEVRPCLHESVGIARSFVEVDDPGVFGIGRVEGEGDLADDLFIRPGGAEGATVSTTRATRAAVSVGFSVTAARIRKK